MKEHPHGPPSITVQVSVPSQVEPMEFTWPQTLKVGDAARQVAEAFGLTAENPTLQNAQGQALDRQKPLVAAGVRDGDRLDLVDAGGGVLTVSREVTVAAVESELPALNAYASRHGWRSVWTPEVLLLKCSTTHPVDGAPFELSVDLKGYRALPPAWTIEASIVNGQMIRRRPSGGSIEGKSSIFHRACDICAPFNRRAFKEHGGPHKNWGGAANWLEVREVVQAYTLADMLAVITAHLHASPGWTR